MVVAIAWNCHGVIRSSCINLPGSVWTAWSATRACVCRSVVTRCSVRSAIWIPTSVRHARQQLPSSSNSKWWWWWCAMDAPGVWERSSILGRCIWVYSSCSVGRCCACQGCCMSFGLAGQPTHLGSNTRDVNTCRLGCRVCELARCCW